MVFVFIRILQSITFCNVLYYKAYVQLRFYLLKIFVQYVKIELWKIFLPLMFNLLKQSEKKG